MERLIRVDQNEIVEGKPDNFALQWVLKNFRARYEYLVDGSWVERPQSKPDGKRVLFDDISDFEAARDTYVTWIDLNGLKVDNPVFAEVIMARAARSRLQSIPLVLFSPWGARAEGDFGEPEMTVLRRLKTIQEIFTICNIPTQPIIMPADLYATEVNNQISPSKVNDYFSVMADEAIRLGFLVKPWSEIRAGNLEYYNQRAQELTDQEILRLIGENIVEEAIDTSGRRSGYKRSKDIEIAAFAYLRERICEAEIVETNLSPIKVSLVIKNKDNGVDRNLPRIYVIPREERFPWLKT